jgi:hypothetical protein
MCSFIKNEENIFQRKSWEIYQDYSYFFFIRTKNLIYITNLNIVYMW